MMSVCSIVLTKDTKIRAVDLTVHMLAQMAEIDTFFNAFVVFSRAHREFSSLLHTMCA